MSRYNPFTGEGYCRGCQAPIRWVRTRKGKSMPLDEDVITVLDVSIDVFGLDGERVVPVDGQDRTGRRCHFVTCPNAKDFKRKRKPESEPVKEDVIPF